MLHNSPSITYHTELLCGGLILKHQPLGRRYTPWHTAPGSLDPAVRDSQQVSRCLWKEWMNCSGNASRQAQWNWSCAQAIYKHNLGVQAKLLETLYSLHSLCRWDPAPSFLPSGSRKPGYCPGQTGVPGFFVCISLSIHPSIFSSTIFLSIYHRSILIYHLFISIAHVSNYRLLIRIYHLCVHIYPCIYPFVLPIII